MACFNFRLCWRPVTGEDIAVPSEKEIKLYARGTWSYIYSYQFDKSDKVPELIF